MKLYNTDSVQRFILENHDVRGVIIHLSETYKNILKQHHYPAAVQKVLGEVILASALLAETIKLQGRMTIQFQSEGKIKLLVAQINDEGHLRALAQWEPDATHEELLKGLGKGELVITIFHKNHEKPLQSIVSLQHASVADALSHYFLQSEQVPTLFSFAVTEESAAGLLFQMMPEKITMNREALWGEIVEKINKIDLAELNYDNNVSFLSYHFADEAIRFFDAKPLVFQCGCTVQKMENAIYVIGQAEANLILKEKSEIIVTCEYCNHHYGFNREAVERIFRREA